MSATNLLPCPFCGGNVIDAPDLGVSNIERAEYGFELRHYCFEGIRGNQIAVRTLFVRGRTKEEVIKRWNGIAFLKMFHVK